MGFFVVFFIYISTCLDMISYEIKD